ncbi:MAG TPA: hypothetical protein VFK13_09535 [Gemmatimonadaceae bacterium]|nr:hypothetical protein [Gemmatimonadaceae bacterium]
MSTTVHALVPLSLLDAVRRVDSPQDELDAEFVPELRNKRLGLSDTVYAQIRRFDAAARKGQRVDHDEVAGIAKLIGRRSDAESVFRAAGRQLARKVYEETAPLSRQLVETLPGLLARPLALRRIRAIAAHYLDGTIRRVGPSVLLGVTNPVTLCTAAPPASGESAAGPDTERRPAYSVGCAFYEACLHELLRLYAVSGGTVDHVHCAAREEGLCEWRAEWRPLPRDEATDADESSPAARKVS